MAAEAILRGANGTETEALGYVNEVRSRAYMSGKYAKSGVRSDVSGEIGLNELSLNFIPVSYTHLTLPTKRIV